MYYRVRKSAKWFNKNKKYADINWNNFGEVVGNFRDRIADWYLDPGETLKIASQHYGFPVLALSCLLIDTLSQYDRGSSKSTGADFEQYVASHMSDFSGQLPKAIDVPAGGKKVTSYAQLLYQVRCGVLHEASMPLYSGIKSGKSITESHAGGYATYANGSPCLTVIIDPFKLFDEVKVLFDSYITKLLDPNTQHDVLRKAFKKRFTAAFGVDLTGALAAFPGPSSPVVASPSSGSGPTPTASG